MSPFLFKKKYYNYSFTKIFLRFRYKLGFGTFCPK